MRRWAALALALLIAGAVLSGCGRKGPLEPPSDYQGPPPPKEERRVD